MQSATCSTVVDAPACTGNEPSAGCASDADCNEKPNGVCRHQDYGCGGASSSCDCIYPCETDADCGATQACLCNDVFSDTAWSACVNAGCRTGDDCPSGDCGAAVHTDAFGDSSAGLYCRQPTDTCRADNDCSGNDPLCVGTKDEWSCGNLNYGGCGRALTVGEHARTAPSITRQDWCATLQIDVEGLSAAERAALAKEWAEMAAYEHASVASFARFALQLMQLGAPPHLLHDVHRAALDEIEHARVAYAVASTYAGHSIGPGPLDLSGVTVCVERNEALRALVLEACVSETLGVLELRERADAAVDPAIRAVLSAIADDEEQHAALAWRALAWLLGSANDEARRLVSVAFDDARALVQTDALRSAYELVIEPCRQALAA